MSCLSLIASACNVKICGLHAHTDSDDDNYMPILDEEPSKPGLIDTDGGGDNSSVFSKPLFEWKYIFIGYHTFDAVLWPKITSASERSKFSSGQVYKVR